MELAPIPWPTNADTITSTTRSFFRILFIFCGFPNSWRFLSRQLNTRMVPNVAFVMGYHDRLGRPANAKSFFQVAIDKSPADSPVRRWAEKAMKPGK